MMSEIDAEPHPQELNGNEKLQWCLENLGESITTVAVNPDGLDAGVVRDWAEETVPEVALPKISILYGAAKTVSEVYDDETARAFLRGSNSIAGDNSLLVVIADAEPEEAKNVVNMAVKAFLE